jgi:hypothetical protein
MSDVRSIASRVPLSTVILLVVGLLAAQTGRSHQIEQKKGERQSVEQMEATPFTEKNARQAIEGSQMPETRMGSGQQRTLPELVRETGKDAGLSTYPMPAEIPGHPSDPPGTLITQESDIVVIGTVTEKQSFLTEHQTDVFTEHALTVSEVLKNDAGHSVQPGSTVYVARTGGSISFEGHLIYHMIGGRVKPLKVGATYLLFLKRLSDLSDSYTGRAFQVENYGLEAWDGLKEFDDGFPLSEARKNIIVAAKAGDAK